MGLEYINQMVLSTVHGCKLLELCCGDIGNMDEFDKVDYLVVSAFPKDYMPINGSIIKKLSDKKIILSELAKCKEFENENCWISVDIENTNSFKTEFKRILMIELSNTKQTEELSKIRNIFSTINNFDSIGNKKLLIPMLFTGSGGNKVVKIFELLLKEAYEALSKKMNFYEIKLLVFSKNDIEQCDEIFKKFKLVHQ